MHVRSDSTATSLSNVISGNFAHATAIKGCIACFANA